jgi:hypothetical protein
MSDTQQRVVKAFNELRARLAKSDVVLDPASRENGQALVAYCIQHGLDYQNATVDTLQTAFDALWPTPGALKFVKGKEPKAMRSKGPIQGTLNATVAAQKDADARAELRKKQEVADAESKKQKDAEAATNEAIAGFLLTSGGRARYAPTEDFKKILKFNVEKFRKDKKAWTEIFPIVKEWIAGKYQEFENQQSQSIGGGL